jgi:hypothetical protein
MKFKKNSILGVAPFNMFKGGSSGNFGGGGRPAPFLLVFVVYFLFRSRKEYQS